MLVCFLMLKLILTDFGVLNKHRVNSEGVSAKDLLLFSTAADFDSHMSC